MFINDMYENEMDEVQTEVFVPFEGEIKKVELLGEEIDVAFTKVEGGYRFTGLTTSTKAPIAQVFRIHTK